MESFSSQENRGDNYGTSIELLQIVITIQLCLAHNTQINIYRHQPDMSHIYI